MFFAARFWSGRGHTCDWLAVDAPGNGRCRDSFCLTLQSDCFTRRVHQVLRLLHPIRRRWIKKKVPQKKERVNFHNFDLPEWTKRKFKKICILPSTVTVKLWVMEPWPLCARQLYSPSSLVEMLLNLSQRPHFFTSPPVSWRLPSDFFHSTSGVGLRNR